MPFDLVGGDIEEPSVGIKLEASVVRKFRLRLSAAAWIIPGVAPLAGASSLAAQLRDKNLPASLLSLGGGDVRVGAESVKKIWEVHEVGTHLAGGKLSRP